MSQKYVKPTVKYVSRKAALQRLNISEKQFDRLTVLFGIYPVVADTKNCYDKVDGWYYKIDDIRKIFYSETYEILNKNVKKETKREHFLRFQQLDRASKIIMDEFNLVDLIKQKYDSLGKSIDDLGNTLRNLYVIDLLSVDDVKNEIEMFEKFVIERKLLNRAFMSKNGVYFSIDIENIIVCWMIPYSGVNLNELVEEKLEVQTPKPTLNIDFLDFGSLSEEESESEEAKDPNDPNKFDISLLRYASPLLKIHLKLCLHKLGLLYSIESCKNDGIFKDMVFHIDIKSIHHHLVFGILSCGGSIGDIIDTKFVISETVDQIDPEKVYVQPQYIFDCINNKTVLPTAPYIVGKSLPTHVSPFPNVIDKIDERSLKLLSNKKKYSVLDRVESLD